MHVQTLELPMIAHEARLFIWLGRRIATATKWGIS